MNAVTKIMEINSETDDSGFGIQGNVISMPVRAWTKLRHEISIHALAYDIAMECAWKRCDGFECNLWQVDHDSLVELALRLADSENITYLDIVGEAPAETVEQYEEALIEYFADDMREVLGEACRAMWNEELMALYRCWEDI